MKTMTLAIQTLFSELEQRVQDADFSETFDRSGTFKKMKRGHRYYWYWQYREGKKVKQKYVGPFTTKEITERVKRFSKLKADYDQRREIVRSLISAGLPSADYLSGEITEAMCRAGFFRLRGVLVGTTAYQCYAGILGVKLPGPSIRTQDADFAQFFAIANQIDDAMPPIHGVLQNVDHSFRPVPHLAGEKYSTAFINDDKYRVEFLTPNRGSDDYEGKPAKMPALSGASAEPLRFLDFLIRHPVHSAILHGGGIPVTIPSPERYAVHKLIISERRSDRLRSKVEKDLMQASYLIQAMWKRRSADLSLAWQEAWERGPAWRKALLNGLSKIDRNIVGQLGHAVTTGATRRRKDPKLFWPSDQLEFELPE